MDRADDREGISRLHDEIFGATEFDASDRFERISALVFKVLEPEGVVLHDRIVPATPPARSENQIDVVLLLGEDARRHILIECRYLKNPVKKSQAQAHWAAAEQAGAEAVMVSTAGFQSGAITYARDKGMRLIQVRQFTDADREGRVMELAVDVGFNFRIGPNVELHPTTSEVDRLAGQGLQPPFELSEANLHWEFDRLQTVDGQDLGPTLEVLAARGATMDVGETTIPFDPPVRVDYFGEEVAIQSLDWSVTTAPVRQRIVVGRDLGEPRLVAIEVVHDELNRAIFDRHLKRLAVAYNGQVVPANQLVQVENDLRQQARDAADGPSAGAR